MENRTEKLLRLKKEKNAVILAHYYTLDEIQSIADYVGDSYYLAKVARNLDADTVVFCGVAFMAESVKILNPQKTVLVPDATADCAMAHMASEEKIAELRSKYDDLAVVCYINSTAALKTLSDICVTSSNALKIVNNLPNKNIFFIPDGNLGRYVKEKITDKNIILNDGYCPVHASATEAQLKELKAKHPNAVVLTHPECVESVVALSDVVGSTAELIKYADESDEKEFIVCTEEGVGYPMRKNNPEKSFYFVGNEFICPDMKLSTVEKVINVLETGENEIKIDEKIRKRAMIPLDRMLEVAKR